MRWEDRVNSFIRLIVHFMETNATHGARFIPRVAQRLKSQNRRRSESGVVVCLTGGAGSPARAEWPRYTLGLLAIFLLIVRRLRLAEEGPLLSNIRTASRRRKGSEHEDRRISKDGGRQFPTNVVNLQTHRRGASGFVDGFVRLSDAGRLPYCGTWTTFRASPVFYLCRFLWGFFGRSQPAANQSSIRFDWSDATGIGLLFQFHSHLG